MVASKYLYDDGEVDEVFNDDWAEAGRLDSVAEMNRLEIEFLCAVEWSLHVQVNYTLLSSDVKKTQKMLQNV